MFRASNAKNNRNETPYFKIVTVSIDYTTWIPGWIDAEHFKLGCCTIKTILSLVLSVSGGKVLHNSCAIDPEIMQHQSATGTLLRSQQQ